MTPALMEFVSSWAGGYESDAPINKCKIKPAEDQEGNVDTW